MKNKQNPHLPFPDCGKYIKKAQKTLYWTENTTFEDHFLKMSFCFKYAEGIV